jgi:hypothetical protein
METLSFYGHHDLWIFYLWIRDIDQFFKWHNLFDNMKVRFAKMMFIDETKLYWRHVENCLKRRGKPPITDCTKIK